MKIVFILLGVVAIILIYAATRPDSFRVQRSVIIAAPAEKIFANLNDFHQWQAWSPWAKLDPQMQATYSGAATGSGAIYEWQGNSKVGSGRMEIVESSPNGMLKIKLDFLKPFEAHNIAEFTLQPQGTQTQVTWAMYGPSPYISKLMTTFVSMDSMVGGDFAKGLATLKQVSEK
jgi:uncharacterized protein YndB with AHSA1/START domain